MIPANAVFPAPGHDHERCSAVLMARAERRCAERNVRLTPQRRRVLEIIAASHAAIGAYDILGRLGGEGRAPAPVSIYRALEFLQRHGLVHRVESLNAYVACVTAGARHPAQFLICRRCRTVAEMNSPMIEDAIATGARSAGFSVTEPVVEVGGVCLTCSRVDREPLAC
jgi:Fur family transcriptional regulator, zinc uptake regulator